MTLRLSAIACCSAALALAQGPVPQPTVTKLPVTADSKPFGAAATNLTPLDLSRFGYVEEEYILSGAANVYDWNADGSVTVKHAGAPYANRILVRRPADPARFSGTAIVELPNTARRFDWSMMWGFSHEYFMEHGDAWVQVTMLASVATLKTFDPARYAALSWANPAPEAACPGAKGPSQNEEGLRWDMLSQAAASLKSGETLGGMRAQRVFMTTQTGDIVTYINAIHERARLADGSRAYDGYILRNPGAPARIHQCAPNIGANDPRRAAKYVDVPAIAVVAQGELLASLASRRPDRDDPGGRFRQWEIAAASHIDKWAYVGFPSFEEQKKATGEAQGTPQWPFNARCEPEIVLQDLPLLRYVFNAAFLALDRWVRDGTPAPRAERLQVREGPQPSLVLDEFGIAKGGIRSPYSDVPTAVYTTNSAGGGVCRELGSTTPLSWARLEALYGNRRNYVQKAGAAIDAMLAARFLTPGDARRMRAELLQ
jgi:hypothetical protein